MTIENRTIDNYFTTVNDVFPYGVHLYWLDDTLYDTIDNGVTYSHGNTIPLSHSNSIFSVQYIPFLNQDELHLYKIPYDIERFKYKEDLAQYPISDVQPFVYKISRFENINNVEKPGIMLKRLSTFKCYKPSKSIGGKRSWRNESKLYNYPYSYAYLHDGINQPFEFKYHLCESNDNELWVRQAMNINGDYSLFIKNYKNDSDGMLEQFIATPSRELPSTSSQYANYMATNKNQINASYSNVITNMIGGAVAGSLVNPGVGTVVGAGIGGVSSLINTITNNNASEKDMRNVPNSLNSRGGDFILNMNTVGKTVKLIRYRQREEYLEKIGDYFAMFGYKQNKIMKPNLRDRYYYNFIKTNGVNIKANIPKNHLEQIKKIFDKGVTIWHVDRNGVVVGDISKDNQEI